MRTRNGLWWVATVLIMLAVFDVATASAEQPIFDEMPRWNDGWGVQVLEEYRKERAWMDGRRKDSDFDEDIHLLRLEGVYTWTKSRRITVKIPVVLDARRERPGSDGLKLVERDRGLGDPIVAMPLKSYFNLDGRSGSFTIAPQVRVPGGVQDGYSAFPHVWGAALNAGYETETYDYHVGVSATSWLYSDTAAQPHSVGLNASAGLNVHSGESSGHIKWKGALLYQADSTVVLQSGPTVYWRVSDTWHVQAKVLYDLFEHHGTPRSGGGESYRVGLGAVY